MSIICHTIWGIWDQTPLPSRYRENLLRWQNFLGDSYRIKLWKPPEINSFLKDRPTWEKWVNGYSRPIQKCDILRVMILYSFGGLYLDLDTQPSSELQDMDYPTFIQDKLNAGYCILGVEHPYRIIKKKTTWWIEDMRSHRKHRTGEFLPAIRSGIPEVLPRLANYWMAGPRKHPFFLRVLSLAWDRREICVIKDYDVLYTTGPDLISTIYRESMSDDSIFVYVLENRVFRKLVSHHAWGTWRKKKKSHPKIK